MYPPSQVHTYKNSLAYKNKKPTYEMDGKQNLDLENIP